MWIRGGSIDFSNSPSSLVQQRKLRPKARRPPSLQEDTLGTRGTYLEVKSSGSWGCLQMMTVTPVMSSSSSTATAVSTGSPENTWLGLWARIRLRIISRRTARVKVEENRLDSRSQRCQDLGSHPSPGCPHQEGPSYLQDTSTDKYTLLPILEISEYHQREVPLLTKQEGTSIDNLARFPGGDGAGREP